MLGGSGSTNWVLLLLVSMSQPVVHGADPTTPLDRGGTVGQTPTHRSATWSVEVLLGNIGSFSHTSIAVDPVNGQVFIAYYDAVDRDSRLMFSVPSSGNCGPDNLWKCSGGGGAWDYGEHCSIAVHPGVGGRSTLLNPYYDATYTRLAAWRYSINGPASGGEGVLIDAGDTSTDVAGKYTAVAYDSTGKAWVAYQTESYGETISTRRMVAEWVGDGSGNCGLAPEEGNWNCNDLFVNGFEQSFSSTGITIDGSDRPIVAYYDDHENQPVVARYLGPGGGGTCGPSNHWRCYLVPPRSGDSDAGRHVVPLVDHDGRLTIYYQNSHRQMLEKATYLGNHGESNCGFNSTGMIVNEWKCESIASMQGNPVRGIDATRDVDGYPVVAFQLGADPAPSALQVARPTASPGVTAQGNCGVANSWHCNTIDGGPWQQLADSVSIDADDHGGIFVAYTEIDEYPFPPEYNLKLARLQGSRIFADGFERGSTLAWGP